MSSRLSWKAKLGIAAFIAITALPIIAVVSLYHGWALRCLWNWFLAPLGAPEIGLVHAVGVTLPVQALTSHLQPYQAEEDKPDEPEAKRIVRMWAPALRPLILVGFGAVVRLFL